MAPEKEERGHVVIFPFLSRGHIIPLLHLSTALAARNLKITLITTPDNSSFFHEYLRLPKPNIHVKLVPFPHEPSLPSGIESTHDLPTFDMFPSLLAATFKLDLPFRKALEEALDNGNNILCVVSDFFYGWTLDICKEFGIPRLVFHGMGVFSMAVCRALDKHARLHDGFDESYKTAELFRVEGMPEDVRINYSDVPVGIKNITRAIGDVTEADDVLARMVESEVNSWGVIVNSYAEMEKDFVPFLQSFYNCGKAWLVGPLCLYSDAKLELTNCRSSIDDWLDEKEKGSVVYVSFGTMVRWPEEQLDEIWYGLEATGHHYLWMVRSETWSPPSNKEGENETIRKGLIHRSWAPQMEILRHPSVGMFLSHCGWNSVLEGATAEVPILAWPEFFAEQGLNAKFVADELGIGSRLKVEEGQLVGREIIRDGVREIMAGLGARNLREAVVKMGRNGKSAVEEGGSSSTTLDNLIQELRDYKLKIRTAESVVAGKSVQ